MYHGTWEGTLATTYAMSSTLWMRKQMPRQLIHVLFTAGILGLLRQETGPDKKLK